MELLEPLVHQDLLGHLDLLVYREALDSTD